MKNKYIINWELLLNCNLNCSFCSQKERRLKNNKAISIEEALKIINNLPNNSHISFLWGETLMFPKIDKLFQALEVRWITYEITTNWILLKKFLEEFKKLNNLKQINISIDWYWDFHDISRWKKWLYEQIKKIIPKLLQIKEVCISTVVTNNTEINLIKLYKELNKLWIKQHKIIYCMNFSKKDLNKSKEKINSLVVSSPWNININNIEYKKQFLKAFILMNKLWLDTKLYIEPLSIFKNEEIHCKQIEKQFRINQNGELSICEFINNSFWNLIEEKFEDIIKDKLFLDLKNDIKNNFPLDICKTCCKLYNKKK